MRKTIKYIFVSCLLLTFVLLVSSCAKDLNPYPSYQESGYTVTVKFDANGGRFTTNTRVRTDTYDLTSYQTNADGKKEIKIFDPADPMRGDQTYLATYEEPGYHLAGWYQVREEVTDENGETTYAYSKPWDFENEKLELDAEAEYTAGEAVLTLYAAWVSDVTYEIYEVDASGNATLIGEPIIADPTTDTGLKLPALNTDTGRVGFEYDFPTLDGRTYDGIYLDAELKNEIKGDVVKHSGNFDRETATIDNTVMKIYCTVKDGLWFEVDTPDKLIKNAYLNANFNITADLDFSGKSWPMSFQSGSFTGSVNGNGHTIKNVTVKQNSGNVSVSNFGLFGQLAEGATVKNLTFDGITLKVTDGSRLSSANFGILAGTVSDNAKIENITLKNSAIEINSNPNKFYITNPTYGLVSGYGSLDGITYSSENVVVRFDGEDIYETPIPDEDGRFQLVKKQS